MIPAIATDEEIIKMIMQIMQIKDEPESRKDLKDWIDEIGINEVFKRVIRLHTVYGQGL